MFLCVSCMLILFLLLMICRQISLVTNMTQFKETCFAKQLFVEDVRYRLSAGDKSLISCTLISGCAHSHLVSQFMLDSSLFAVNDVCY